MALQINTPTPLPQATVGGAYSTTLAASGGTPPYTWAIDATAGFTVPDRHAATDPNVVIDPIGARDPAIAQDSTAGLQAYINSTPAGADIRLDFDLQINGQLTLSGGRILWSANGSALRKTVAYPWRPLGGTACQWQYDAQGGDANQGVALQNPYWLPNGGTRTVTGCTATVGSHTVTSAPGSFTQADVGQRLWAYVSGAWHFDELTHITAVSSDGSRLTVDTPCLIGATNAGFRVTAGVANTGAVNGGYSGSTGISGIDYDGQHLTDRYGAPFNSSHVGHAIQVVINANLVVAYNKIINRVSADGTTAFFSNTDGISQHMDTGGTVAWALTNAGKVWTTTFLPNPAWSPVPHDGGTNKPWNGYMDALNDAQAHNQAATVRLNDTAQLIGMEVAGANTAWRVAIVGYDKSSPVVMEYTHCVLTGDNSNFHPATMAQTKVINCYLHHPQGDCENGPGQVINSRLEYSGRQGLTGHWDHKRVNGCVIQQTHHSIMDVELPGGGANSDVQFVNNCLGGPHGIAWSSQLKGFLFQGNHSVRADITAGTISSLAPYSRVQTWGGGGSNVQILNNHFDIGVGSGHPAYDFTQAIAGLTVTGNATPTDTCFVRAPGSTSVVVNNNNGGNGVASTVQQC